MNRLRIVPVVAVLLSALVTGSVFAAAAGEGAAGEERGPITMTYLRFGGPDDITQDEALIARWEERNPGDTIEPLIAPFPQWKEKAGHDGRRRAVAGHHLRLADAVRQPVGQ